MRLASRNTLAVRVQGHFDYIPVGDKKAPLLRVVSTSGNAGTVITRSYERVRYVPVQNKVF